MTFVLGVVAGVFLLLVVIAVLWTVMAVRWATKEDDNKKTFHCDYPDAPSMD